MEGILESRTYADVVVLMANMRSFSGFVRDTHDSSVIPRRLTEFNRAARLMSEAKAGEAVVSNRFYARLDPPQQALLEKIEPIEAKNVGRIRGWRYTHKPGEA